MESCNKNMQQTDYQEIVQKYNPLPINNKAIIQEYSAKKMRSP